MSRRPPPGGVRVAPRPSARGALGALAVALLLIGMAAWLVRDHAAAPVVSLPEPGTAHGDLLDDRVPVLVTHTPDGEVHVLDARPPHGGGPARAPSDGGIPQVVGWCTVDGELVLQAEREWRWDARGQPVSWGGGERAEPPGKGPVTPQGLASYEVEGIAGDRVVRVGDRQPPQPEPVREPAPGRCDADELERPPLPGEPIAADALPAAADGTYRVDAVVEQVGGGVPLLCARPDVLPRDGAASPDALGAPLCDGRGLPLPQAKLTEADVVQDEHLAVRRYGELVVTVDDGRVEVTVGDLRRLSTPVGGELVLEGDLLHDWPGEGPGEGVHWVPVPLPTDRDPTDDLILRAPEVVDGPRNLRAPDLRGIFDHQPVLTSVSLAPDAELGTATEGDVDRAEFTAAARRGALDEVRYEATIDRVSGETVRLVPAD